MKDLKEVIDIIWKMVMDKGFMLEAINFTEIDDFNCKVIVVFKTG